LQSSLKKQKSGTIAHSLSAFICNRSHQAWLNQAYAWQTSITVAMPLVLYTSMLRVTYKANIYRLHMQ